jgi:hypothetical protein
MARSFKAQKLHHHYVCTFSFLNRICSIIIEGGQISLSFLAMIFEIAKLYFWFCCHAPFWFFSFVVVLSIGFANVRLDQT